MNYDLRLIKMIMKNKILKFLLFVMALHQLCYAQVNVIDVPIDQTSGNNQAENAVFISPRSKFVIINSNNSTPGVGPIGFSVSHFISTNGGQSLSWTGDIYGPNPSVGHGDPSVVIDRSGRIISSYLGYVVFPGVRHLEISYSDDNGVSWTAVQIPGSFVNADKQHMWVDNNLNSPYEGRIHMAFNDQFCVCPFDIVYTYSDDGGVTWLAPPLENLASTVSPQAAFENLGVNLQTGPLGQVYACWSAIDDAISSVPDNTRIYFNKSLDGGDTWLGSATEILTVTGAGIALGGGKGGPKMYPFMAVNQQTGTLYIVWANNNGITGGSPVSDADIHMIKSEDEGDTWSAPIRVNQDPIGNFRDQWSPWIACDEISNALVVLYYDSRNFPANNRAETFVSISYDDGNTWEDHQISDVGEDWSGTPFSIPGQDYMQVDVYHGLVIPVWSDNRPSAGSDFRAYTNPFEVPCTQDLDLIYGDYNIYDQGDYTDYPTQFYDGFYRTTRSINVAGGGSTYKVKLGAEVRMEAAEEIVLRDGFETEGEFEAIPNPTCVSFSEKWGGSNSTDEEQTNNNENIKEEFVNKEDELVQKENLFAIYPNPTTGKLILTVPQAQEDNISIYITDILGRRIFEKRDIKETAFAIDISGQDKGIYFIEVINGNETYAAKIIYQ